MRRVMVVVVVMVVRAGRRRRRSVEVAGKVPERAIENVSLHSVSHSDLRASRQTQQRVRIAAAVFHPDKSASTPETSFVELS